MYKRIYKRKGFTLIELIVVIAILAIIAAVAVPTAFASLNSARAAACASNMGNIKSAIRVEQAETLANNAHATGNTITVAEVEAALENCEITNVPAPAVGVDETIFSVENLCPSGGDYAIILHTKAMPNTVSIICSEHGGDSVTNSIVDGINGLLNDGDITTDPQRQNNTEGSFMSWQDSINNDKIKTWLEENGYNTDTAWRADYRTEGGTTKFVALVTAVDMTNDQMQALIDEKPNGVYYGYVKVVRTTFNDDGTVKSAQEGYARIIRISNSNGISDDETRVSISVQKDDAGDYFKTELDPRRDTLYPSP